ncbi:hypothetical protein [Sinomonas halotolerans]|uniref:DUF2207 domain-containing protein n=1 Tax=Sinomonas halotolerans TaxID=1644133 RepID=A0ABU9X0P2_9MICC
MPADQPFYGPLGYSGFWLFLGLALAAAAAVWFAYAVLSTRAPRTGDLPVPLYHAPPGLRRTCLARIDEVEGLLASGRISPRSAIQEVSGAVRDFVQGATGIRASRMTLEELRDQGIPAAAAAVESLYPGEFSAAGPEDARAALETARTVVRTWT